VRFSVIIVNFNGVSWLGPCLESLRAQVLDVTHSMEVIVVDNGSDDASVEILRRTHRDVVLVESPVNMGFSTGCDTGIAHASGETLVFLNNDTRLDPNAIQSLFDEKIERQLDVIAAVEVPYDGGVIDVKRAMIDPLGFPIFRGSAERFGRGSSFFLSAACVMVDKTTYADSGGLDTSFFMYYEDVDWFWRMKLYGLCFDYSQRTVVYHFVTGSAHGLKFDYKRFVWRNSNQPRILIKNYRARTLLVVMPIYLLVSLVEAVALLVIGRRDLTMSYVTSTRIIARNRQKLIDDRRAVQRRRTIGDWEVLSQMYPGLASANGLWGKFIAIKNRSV